MEKVLEKVQFKDIFVSNLLNLNIQEQTFFIPVKKQYTIKYLQYTEQLLENNPEIVLRI